MDASTSEITIYPHASQSMKEISDESIHLVVTSPPYPMIAMWDDLFVSQNPAIGEALTLGDGEQAFEGMHQLLDQVWKECHRVLCPSGFLCINIGDATRTVEGQFQLYSNHTRITEACRRIGFDVLPLILWKKTTNAPTKFMGSGMYPAGAYVTLEHEYILIFRKGGKRLFRTLAEKKRRQESAYFWEERNQWFTDQWDIGGVRQELSGGKGLGENLSARKLRSRSAAFPLTLPLRLILMYSIKGDWVLDPFLGLGTTLLAAAICGRNGVGYEIEAGCIDLAKESILSCGALSTQFLEERVGNHRQFVSNSARDGYYSNKNLELPVITKQETEILLEKVETVLPSQERTNAAASSFLIKLVPFCPDPAREYRSRQVFRQLEL